MISTLINFRMRHVSCIVFQIDKRHDITFFVKKVYQLIVNQLGVRLIVQGTEIPGKPARLTGVVNKSFAYIVKGSSISSPILNAVVGAVGPTTTS